MKRLLAFFFIVTWALLMPLTGLDGREQDLIQSLASPSLHSLAQCLGFDVYGRSVLARLADATRQSLALAGLAVALAVGIGASLACVASVANLLQKHWLDTAVVTVADMCCAVPGLLWVLLGSLALGGSDVALYVGLALAMWVEFFRVLRSLAIGVVRTQAVEASRLLGLPLRHVLSAHLWPACKRPVARLLALNLAQAVLAVAALGFVGVGLKPPRADLGLMMTEYLPHYSEAPWLIAAPTAVLMLFVLGAMALVRPEKPLHNIGAHR